MGGPSDLYRQVEHYREVAWKAEAEVERMTRERDEALAEVASTRADLHLSLKTNVAMQDDIDRLRALLREVQLAARIVAIMAEEGLNKL